MIPGYVILSSLGSVDTGTEIIVAKSSMLYNHSVKSYSSQLMCCELSKGLNENTCHT